MRDALRSVGSLRKRLHCRHASTVGGRLVRASGAYPDAPARLRPTAKGGKAQKRAGKQGEADINRSKGPPVRCARNGESLKKRRSPSAPAGMPPIMRNDTDFMMGGVPAFPSGFGPMPGPAVSGGSDGPGLLSPVYGASRGISPCSRNPSLPSAQNWKGRACACVPINSTTSFATTGPTTSGNCRTSSAGRRSPQKEVLSISASSSFRRIRPPSGRSEHGKTRTQC